MTRRLNLPDISEIKKALKKEDNELPSFSQVVGKTLAVCNDPDAPMEDVVKLLETDPGISTKVLAIVNSSFVSLRRKISAVSEAIHYLGLDEIKKICLGVTLFEKVISSGSRSLLNRKFFWRHCLCVASLSQAIAKEVGYPRHEDAYIGGLLHDIGKIVLDQAGRVNYADFMDNISGFAGQMSEAERGIMGLGHDDLGAYYAEIWNLPEPLCLVIQYHHRRFGHLNIPHEDMQFISIVSLANFLAWTQGMGAVDIISPPALQPEVGKTICLEDIDFEKVIRKMDEEIENTARFYRFTFPSSDQVRVNLLQANLKLSAINAGHFFPGPGNESEKASSTVTDSITAPHRSLDPKKIISGTLKAVCDDFGFDRIYILKVAKPRRHLEVMEFLDQGKFSDKLASVYIPLEKDAGGFIQCLRNRKPVVISGAARGEKKALKKFSVRQMLIVPFCSHDTVIGILGMDHAVSGKSIEPELFSSIAVVANELGLALENASAYLKARSASRRDGLTGLLNRMAVEDCLGKAFSKAAGDNTPFAVIMIDVDFFKKFNDRFGHQAGDNVLKLIAGTLKKVSRPFDQVGRFGGEEFIVILNDSGLLRAQAYAERVRSEIERLGNLLSDRFPGLKLTVSIGVSKYEPDIEDQEILIKKADQALYRAKNAGRNRVETSC